MHGNISKKGSGCVQVVYTQLSRLGKRYGIIDERYTNGKLGFEKK